MWQQTKQKVFLFRNREKHRKERRKPLSFHTHIKASFTREAFFHRFMWLSQRRPPGWSASSLTIRFDTTSSISFFFLVLLFDSTFSLPESLWCSSIFDDNVIVVTGEVALVLPGNMRSIETSSRPQKRVVLVVQYEQEVTEVSCVRLRRLLTMMMIVMTIRETGCYVSSNITAVDE